MFTDGATPSNAPPRSREPAAMQAHIVPCPFQSFQGSSPRGAQPLDALDAKSGWLPSTPVSTTARVTFTPFVPSNCQARVASIFSSTSSKEGLEGLSGHIDEDEKTS